MVLWNFKLSQYKKPFNTPSPKRPVGFIEEGFVLRKDSVLLWFTKCTQIKYALGCPVPWIQVVELWMFLVSKVQVVDENEEQKRVKGVDT